MPVLTRLEGGSNQPMRLPTGMGPSLVPPCGLGGRIGISDEVRRLSPEADRHLEDRTRGTGGGFSVPCTGISERNRWDGKAPAISGRNQAVRE